jgi:hypothetical protein
VAFRDVFSFLTDSYVFLLFPILQEKVQLFLNLLPVLPIESDILYSSLQLDINHNVSA